MTENNKPQKSIPKPHLTLPVVVEGRYDKSAILGMLDGTVITTEGFAVFNSKEKQALIRRLAGDRGIIVLTDSDGGGRQIRAFLSGILPKDKIYQLYIPNIEGKERRKRRPGKAGLLGVEGVGGEVLKRVLKDFISEDGSAEVPCGAGITPAELYSDGLSGAACAADKRDRLCLELELPCGMSAKALLSALNVAVSREEYERAVEKIQSSTN